MHDGAPLYSAGEVMNYRLVDPQSPNLPFDTPAGDPLPIHPGGGDDAALNLSFIGSNRFLFQILMAFTREPGTAGPASPYAERARQAWLDKSAFMDDTGDHRGLLQDFYLTTDGRGFADLFNNMATDMGTQCFIMMPKAIPKATELIVTTLGTRSPEMQEVGVASLNILLERTVAFLNPRHLSLFRWQGFRQRCP